MTKLQDWDVSFVSTLDMVKVHPQKYITLDELVKEVMPLLSDCVPNTIEEIPVFTSWDAKDLKGNMEHLKNYYIHKQCQLLEQLHEAE